MSPGAGAIYDSVRLVCKLSGLAHHSPRGSAHLAVYAGIVLSARFLGDAEVCVGGQWYVVSQSFRRATMEEKIAGWGSLAWRNVQEASRGPQPRSTHFVFDRDTPCRDCPLGHAPFYACLLSMESTLGLYSNGSVRTHRQCPVHSCPASKSHPACAHSAQRPGVTRQLHIPGADKL